MIDKDKLAKMRAAAPLLPEPGAEVAIELLDEIDRLNVIVEAFGSKKLQDFIACELMDPYGPIWDCKAGKPLLRYDDKVES